MEKNLDDFYMGVAELAATESYAQKRKVGAVAVKNGGILDFSYNGTLPGEPNTCEEVINGKLVTLPTVLHAEEHLLLKLAKGKGGAKDSTIYCNWSPCSVCARLMAGAGIQRLVYKSLHKAEGLALLSKRGVLITQLK